MAFWALFCVSLSLSVSPPFIGPMPSMLSSNVMHFSKESPKQEELATTTVHHVLDWINKFYQSINHMMIILHYISNPLIHIDTLTLAYISIDKIVKVYYSNSISWAAAANGRMSCRTRGCFSPAFRASCSYRSPQNGLRGLCRSDTAAPTLPLRLCRLANMHL